MRLFLSVLLLLVVYTTGAQEYRKNNTIIETVKSGNLQLGSYDFFQNFLANKPSTIDDINLGEKSRQNSSWSGTLEVNPRYVSTGKKVKKVWGFSDGSNVYVWHQVEFFPIVIENDELAFYGYDIIEGDGKGAAGALGGAIGGGIYAAVQLAKAKKNKIRYTIEPNGGAAVHPNYGLNNRKIEGSVRDLVVYRRKKNELEEPAIFIINDSLKYSFVPNSNMRFRFPATKKSVKICTGIELNQCVELELENDATRYIKLERLEEKKVSEFLKVTDSKGEFDYYKTVKDQKRRGPHNPAKL